jgi:hypothetical protein
MVLGHRYFLYDSAFRSTDIVLLFEGIVAKLALLLELAAAFPTATWGWFAERF